MKRVRTWLLLLLPFVMASCMDTREETEIKKDGSGTLVMKVDLSKMIEMMKSFASEEDLQKDGLNKAFDTTMFMKDFVDTARNIPAEKKAVLRNGKVHLNMNIKENLGKFDMAFPFTSTSQLQQLYESLNSSSGGLKNLLGGMGNKPQLQKGDGEDKGLPQIASIYDINIKDGLYSRKVNKDRYNDFVQAIKLDELKQMSGMLGPMNYTFALKLSRPVKKLSNNKATLSDDKKTVTLTTDLMEAFEHPELLELEVEY